MNSWSPQRDQVVDVRHDDRALVGDRPQLGDHVGVEGVFAPRRHLLSSAGSWLLMACISASICSASA